MWDTMWSIPVAPVAVAVVWAAWAVEELGVLDVRVDLDVDRDGPRLCIRGICPTAGDRVHQPLVVVLDVHQGCQHDLLLVRLAARLPRLLARAGEDRKEDRREDRDDRDDDQQLNECKASPSHGTTSSWDSDNY